MMAYEDKYVFIIDDDPAICDGLRWLFESVNFKVETYTSAGSFLEHYHPAQQGCLIVDVRLPIMNGLELLEYLKSKKSCLPILVITGYADIEMAVRAMKLGASDFILKPINHNYLLEVVQKTINLSGDTYETARVIERTNHLTDRERQVIELIVNGKLNKEIAFDLSISISTVEAHRASIMHKMRAKNMAQLIKFYLQSQYDVESL